MTSLASNIRTARLSIGLSQTALARRIGTTPAAVSQWEAGRRTPSATRLRSLCMALEVSADSILGLGTATVPPAIDLQLSVLRGQIATLYTEASV